MDSLIVSKWYQIFDDKSVCSFCSLRVKFNIDLRLSEMRWFYRTKLKNAYTHKQRKNKGELQRDHERTLHEKVVVLVTYVCI